MPTCWIIAGPNGAGKTTFALEFLPQVANCTNFVNADLIAAGLSPLAPEKELIAASRIFLSEIKSLIKKKEDFALETTLSGRSYLAMIKSLQENGWRVELIYLALPTSEVSKLRVAERVAHGGHNIPSKDIERRFPRSLANLFNLFSFRVDQCQCYMNADEDPILIFEQNGKDRIVHQESILNTLMKEANYDNSF
ncbi:zeta toxin family protein [Marinomonas sp. GJ51-6]|uniref:zeta toxin family protein n=1 Tax=Marinomonas sp. GJ51-6 TaxID=2992802 RepID=UPI0029342B31|nr:zeta toxin family protein [Marinomonas sp. GJ51-6]WOD08488.1 zeta toxin family protein [Marinomonas sp. GJ51-6]